MGASAPVAPSYASMGLPGPPVSRPTVGFADWEPYPRVTFVVCREAHSAALAAHPLLGTGMGWMWRAGMGREGFT